MKLQGTVALVTGGAKRVGRAIVLALADAGCDVAIHYRRSHAEADELVEQVTRMGRRAVALAADLDDPTTWPVLIRRTVEALGRLDVLINNASLFLTDDPDTIEGFDAARWEAMLRTNVTAPVALCHHARRHLAEHGAGNIVNLCDIAADRPWPDHLSYGTSKAALVAVTRGLARAMAPSIRVNAVAPGIAVFPETYSCDVRRKLTSRVPLGREGSPGEVAAVVRFLVESGDYMTGQILPVDGGRGLA